MTHIKSGQRFFSFSSSVKYILKHVYKRFYKSFQSAFGVIGLNHFSFFFFNIDEQKGEEVIISNLKQKKTNIVQNRICLYQTFINSIVFQMNSQ